MTEVPSITSSVKTNHFSILSEAQMKSHLAWTALSLFGAFGFMTVALAAGKGAEKNLVVNGDFESGNTGFTTGYTFGDLSGPRSYNIVRNPSTAKGSYGDWCNCGDHTTGSGNMMVINGANSASIPVWEETVRVAPSKTYSFSYWGAEVDHDSSSLPRLLVKINGKVVGRGTIPEKSPDNGGNWQKYKSTWNSRSSTTADLAIFDENTETGWNDFMIDDIRFSTSSAAANNTASGSVRASSEEPITTHAQITVKNARGAVIPLKPQEKTALMFMLAISSMEDDCSLNLNRRCSLAELIVGPKSPNWNIGKLKYDPGKDPNYNYTVAITKTGWTASANPRRRGLGGFFVDGNGLMAANTYYRANGRATTKDIKLGQISASGELFQVH